jgi:hypoxia up-regulated 1
MARLWKEAGRVKAILSANTESSIAVEGLAYDIDFKSKIARETLEKACQDLQIKFTKPILDALKNADISLDEITSVILTGGHSRTPMVQAAVRATVGESKIAHNVNTDESAVLGAAFYGASLSRQFRTKDIKVQDLTPYDLEVSYPSEAKVANTAPRTIRSTIFPAGSKTGVKKTLTIKRKDDFAMRLGYKAGHFPDFPQDVFDAQISGIPDAIANLTGRGAIDPVVKITMLLTESGVASITEAVAYGEVKDESIKGKLKSLISGSSTATSATDSTTETPAPAPTHGGAEEEKEVEVKYTPNNIPLDMKITPLSIRPLNFAEKRKARDLLAAIDSAELGKRKREEARNLLEGYLYRLRDLLDGQDDSPFIEFSKPEEREKLSESLSKTLHWMNEESDDADTNDFWTRRQKLEELESPVQIRYKENETGPKAVDDLQQALWAGRVFLESARQNRTEEDTNGLPHKYTDEELEEVEKKLKENEAWLGPLVEKQKTLKRNDDPVFKTLELKARGIALQRQVMRLLKKKTPVKPKSSPTTGSSTESASSSSSSSSPTSATNTPKAEGTHKKDEL